MQLRLVYSVRVGSEIHIDSQQLSFLPKYGNDKQTSIKLCDFKMHKQLQTKLISTFLCGYKLHTYRVSQQVWDMLNVTF